MKINQIISETTTAGAVAPVSQSFVKMSSRNPVVNSKKGNNLLTGKVTNKKYANSVNEGKMKDLAMDLKSGKDGLTDEEFKKKYGKTKQEMRKAMKEKPEPTKVEEAKLDEDDIIVIPGTKAKRKTGFVQHGQSRVDHEVEMARSDILATIKNAKALYKLLQHRSEEEGLEGWVQEKIIKASDYLNAVKEYYDEKSVQQEGVTENNQRGDTLVTDALKLMRGSEVSDAVRALTTVLGNREYNSRRGHYNFYVRQLMDMYGQRGVVEAGDTAKGQKMLAKVHNRAANRVTSKQADKDPAYARKAQQTQDRAWERLAVKEQGMSEGAKVDRMVKHIEKSEKKLGHSDKEAENIAWATANKRGMLDNKNKKK